MVSFLYEDVLYATDLASLDIVTAFTWPHQWGLDDPWRFLPVFNILWFGVLGFHWTICTLFPMCGRAGEAEEWTGHMESDIRPIIYLFLWMGRGSEASEIKNCQNFYLLYSGMPYLRILLHSRSLYQVNIEATKERKCWNLVSEFFSLD